MQNQLKAEVLERDSRMVYIKEGMYAGEWGIVYGVDGEYLEVGICGSKNTMPVFEPSELYQMILGKNGKYHKSTLRTVGHICDDGNWVRHTAKTCLSCGGWDGVRGLKR